MSPNRMFARLARAYDMPGLDHPVTMGPTVPAMASAPSAPPPSLTPSSVEEAVTAKRPAPTTVGGWTSTPPVAGVPVSMVTEGAIGTVEGPLSRDDYPGLKQLFFDTELAKKEMLLAKCHALQTDREAFQAYQATNQGEGVPVDTAGVLLYGTNTLVTSPSALIDPSLTKATTRPTEGRQMPAGVLERPVLLAGISDVSVRPTALGVTQDIIDDRVPPLGMNHESVKLYDRVTKPPLRMDTFRHGAIGSENALRVVEDPDQKTKEDVVVVQRDPLFQPGTLSSFDFCADLPDSTRPPFRVDCLQHLFRGVGGLPAGSAYPGDTTMTRYHMMADLGAVKQYFHLLAKNVKSEDAVIRERALLDLFGISAGTTTRTPYHPGVEVFWFLPVVGQPNQVAVFLKRTVEATLLTFDGTRRIPQIEEWQEQEQEQSTFSMRMPITMIQTTDVRATRNMQLRFAVQVDHGFFLAVQQPTSIERDVFETLQEDKPGVFANLVDGPQTYVSEAWTPFRADGANIMKLFYEDADGGEHLLRLHVQERGSESIAARSPVLETSMYSLTCEPHAPFLCFEVNCDTMEWEERRHAGLFAQLLRTVGLEYHTRLEEMAGVPGGKGFVRMNGSYSVMSMSLSHSSWATLTVAFRFVSMPVKETLLTLRAGDEYYSVIVRPDSGSVAKVLLEHRLGVAPKVLETVFRIELTHWYILMIQQDGNGIRLAVQRVEEMSQQRGVVSTTTTPRDKGDMKPPLSPDSYHVVLGSHGLISWPSIYGSTSFFYDIAWVHFFDYLVSANDLYREARADWIYTASPM